ncbi:MAG: DUF86 domain-containing protein [Armatimonadia bacterium]
MTEDRLYLAHILEAIQYIRDDAAAGHEAFMADRRLRQLIFHNLQIIGEATKQVSAEAKAHAPHVPWRQIAGLRDALVHNYDGINPDRIWDIAENEIPRLESAVKALLAIVEAGAEGPLPEHPDERDT